MRTFTSLDYSGMNDPDRLLDIYLPDGDAFDTVVFFHGGGLKEGNRTWCSILPLVSRGIAVVSVEYRMLPKVHFPGFLFDAAQAISYAKSVLPRYGWNRRLYVMGDSAGAYISMMLCLDRTYYDRYGVDPDSITGYISNSAQMLAHFNLLKDRGFDPDIERIDETAPIRFVKRGLSIRPLLMLWYDHDMPCRPEENRLMAASLARFLPKDSILHCFELEGKHCAPKDVEVFLSRVEGFIRFVDEKEQ